MSSLHLFCFIPATLFFTYLCYSYPSSIFSQRFLLFSQFVGDTLGIRSALFLVLSYSTRGLVFLEDIYTFGALSKKSLRVWCAGRKRPGTVSCGVIYRQTRFYTYSPVFSRFSFSPYLFCSPESNKHAASF